MRQTKSKLIVKERIVERPTCFVFLTSANCLYNSNFYITFFNVKKYIIIQKFDFDFLSKKCLLLSKIVFYFRANWKCNVLCQSRSGVANPGPAGHFWPARTFRMALEDFLIDPDRIIVT
jgi:hypothetical protein